MMNDEHPIIIRDTPVLARWANLGIRACPGQSLKRGLFARILLSTKRRACCGVSQPTGGPPGNPPHSLGPGRSRNQ